MRNILIIQILFLSVLSPVRSSSYSSPLAIGCHYKLSKKSEKKTDICLFERYFNMGAETITIQPIRSKNTFIFYSNEQFSRLGDDGVIRGGGGRPLFFDAKLFKSNKKIWEGSYQKFSKGIESLCQAGQRKTIKYALENGGFICFDKKILENMTN